MGKNKLKKFRDMETFDCVFQCPFAQLKAEFRQFFNRFFFVFGIVKIILIKIKGFFLLVLRQGLKTVFK